MSTRRNSRMISPEVVDRLIGEAQGLGLELMYRYQINSNQHPYYVPVRHARETRLFFYMPNKAFIVMLRLGETVAEDGEFYSSWGFDLYVHWDMPAVVRSEAEVNRGHNPAPGQEWPPSPILDVLPPHPGFRFLTGLGLGDHDNDSFIRGFRFDEEDHTGRSALRIMDIADLLRGLVEHCSPWLRPKFEDDFPVAGFAPNYTFRGIESRFWRAFPRRLIFEMVKGRVFGFPRRTELASKGGTIRS